LCNRSVISVIADIILARNNETVFIALQDDIVLWSARWVDPDTIV